MKRALLLLACIAIGLAVGVAGYMATGSQWWFLALPAVMALAWLFVANPEQCMAGNGPCEPDRREAAK